MHHKISENIIIGLIGTTIIFLALLIPKITSSKDLNDLEIEHTENNNLDDNAKDQLAFIALSNILEKMQFINANFSQSISNKAGTVIQEQAGTVQLKKPNLLNWQVLTPDHLSIIIDGEKIWNYDFDLEQIIVKKLSDNLHDNPIAQVLLGDLTKNLNAFQVSYWTDDCNTDICFVLYNNSKLKSQATSFIRSYLGFNRNNQLVFLKLIDQLEQETTFNFFKFKNHVDPKAFKFIVPKGVDVIEEN